MKTGWQFKTTGYIKYRSKKKKEETKEEKKKTKTKENGLPKFF